jgi:starch-binding outer membrane protein, SusD/RagB family
MNLLYKCGKIRLTLILLMVIISLTRCRKLVDIPAPSDALVDKNVYTDDATAIAVLTGIYTNMSRAEGTFTGFNSITFFSGLSADELSLFSGASSSVHEAYYKNALSVSTVGSFGSEHWSPLYNYIFECNAAIEKLSANTSLTSACKQQLLGEAKFLRAFYYFYLVNLFGDVPLVVSTDYKLTPLLSRSSKSSVYRQIIADLMDAKDLLSEDYLDGALQSYTGDIERVRPTTWAASALLSRVLLYTGAYAEATTEASRVIDQAALFSLGNVSEVFLKNSSEAIWQLQPVSAEHNTEDGWIFDLHNNGPDIFSHSVYLSPQLLSSFEAGDERSVGANWVDSVIVGGITYYYPNKYKSNTLGAPLTEYLMVLRLGEQYLIRAEARAHVNDITGAQDDLNRIRSRAGLPNIAAYEQATLLAAILHERQVELFTEWGHRWLDLKRTGAVDSVLSVVTPLKANGAGWHSYQQWYPLPVTDLRTAPNLVQNSGY